MLTIIRKQLESIVAGDATGLLTIGILGALWSSSGAMTSIVSALNAAYDIPETRPMVEGAPRAIALTIASRAFRAAVVHVDRRRTECGALAGGVVWVIGCLRQGLGDVRWPLVFALATTGIAIVFYYAPDADQDWVWITPGSIADDDSLGVVLDGVPAYT